MLEALLKTQADGSMVLAAPKLGVFMRELAPGDVVRPGVVIGVLRVLQRRYRVIAPEGALGEIKSIDASPSRPVGYGDVLLSLGAASELVRTAATAATKTTHQGELSLKAPIHGIFYRRASPESPAYVEAGQTISRGQTVGLIEVMKTFNPVIYEGPGLPEKAVVLEVVAGERQEVSAGGILLTLKAG